MRSRGSARPTGIDELYAGVPVVVALVGLAALKRLRLIVLHTT
jgi:hypothetical protein